MIERSDFSMLFVKTTIFLLCFFSFSLAYWVYRKANREKCILESGKAAPAVLIKMKKYSFRDIRLVWLTYHFVDETGVSVHGSYGPYGADRKIHPTAASAWESKLSNLTVVYDPKDSRKNILYPAHYAELR
jgi:hypothetical protein